MINIHNLISVFNRHNNWPEVKKIILTLNKNGFTAYLAGGCVRDALLNNIPKDFDIATSARSEEVLRLFPRGNKQGKAFGVVAIFCSKGPVEVATFRKDGPYADGRHPQYVEFLSDREDALRRDFTVNALFYDVKTERVIDYVGGVGDLKKKIIRTVGNPEQRFQEDHLRILRALRFSIKLDFEIEKYTKKAVFQMKGALLKISRERIYEECLKILKTGNFTRALSAFKELSLLNNFLFSVTSISEQTVNNEEISWDFCLKFWNQPVPVELMSEKKFLWTYVFFPILIQVEERSGLFLNSEKTASDTANHDCITRNEKWKKAFSDNLKEWKFPSALIRAVSETFYSSCCILGLKPASFGKKLRVLNSDFSRSILFLCRCYLKTKKLCQQARESDQRTDQSMDQLIDQHTDQSMDQLIDQHTDQSMDQLIDQHTDQRIDQRTDQSMDQLIDQHTDQRTDQSMDQRIDIDKLEREFTSRAPGGKLPKPLINGNDLKALGILEDKNMAHILESLYDRQLEQRITDRKILLGILK